MSNTATQILTKTSTRIQNVGMAAGSSEAILCLTDVARLLSCSVDEAKALLIKARVPSFRLPSGTHRFLMSSVLEAIRAHLKPYEDNAAAEDKNRDAENEEITHAWESWVLSRGDGVLQKLDEDWRQWMRLMQERRMRPEEFFALSRLQRIRLIRRVQCRPNSLPFNETGDPLSEPLEIHSLSTTTRIRGTLLGRKVFE